MKTLIVSIIALFIGILIVSHFFDLSVLQSAMFQKSETLTPLPSIFTIFKNNQTTTLDFWIPSAEKITKTSLKEPEISGKSSLVYDVTTDKVLYSKSPSLRLPMASLTKIMTAIVSLENKKSDNKYVVSKHAAHIGEDALGLSENEAVTQEDLLYGLILHSGNDAAEVLADGYKYGRDAFVKAMNNKAKSLGISDTHFTNPTGLEGDGNQYTTAYDLLVMTRYALFNFPLFKEVSQTFQHTIPYSSLHKEFYLENETNLLTSYPGVKGVKTGYTPEAGLTLVTYLEYQNHKIIGVLLGSNNRRGEMIELLDYALKVQNIIPPKHGR